MQTYRARGVLRADHRGSSWPVMVDTDAGLFYTKLRGAAQAPASLVAEVIVGGLADALDLPVPARVLIDIGPGLVVDDPSHELARLLEASKGLSLGFQHLPQVTDFQAGEVDRVGAELASAILWLDGLVQNPDRVDANPNLIWSQGRLWLIDHGACLGFHHNWSALTEESPRTPGDFIKWHVFRRHAGLLPLADSRLAPRLTPAVLQDVVAAVPAEYLAETGSGAIARRRATYVAYLWKRLKAPRPFVARD